LSDGKIKRWFARVIAVLVLGQFWSIALASDQPQGKYVLLELKSQKDLRLYNLPDEVPYLSAEQDELKAKGLELERVYEILQQFLADKPDFRHNGRYQLFVKKWPLHQEIRHIIMNEEEARWGRAETLCRQIIDLDAQEPLAHYHLGFVLRRLKRYEESEQTYLKAIELMPDYGNFYANLGRTYEAWEQRDKAITAWSKALELMPGDTPSLEALERLGVLVSVYSDPQKPETKMWIERKDYEQAMLKKLEEIKDDPEKLKTSGITLVHDGTREIGLRYLKRAADLRPDDPETWMLLAATYHQTKEYEKGLQAIDRHLKLQPSSGYGYTNKAKLIDGLGREEEALVLLKKALELEPNQENALQWYYLTMREKGAENEGRDFLKSLAERYPHAFEPYLVLAVYQEENDLNQSIKWYGAAFERAPSDIKAAYAYAGALGKAGRYSESVNVLEPFRSRIMENWRMVWNLGQSYFYSGKQREAINLFKQALARPEILPERRQAMQHQINFWEGKVESANGYIQPYVFLYVPGIDIVTLAGENRRMPYQNSINISTRNAPRPLELQLLQGVGPTPGENRLLRRYLLSDGFTPPSLQVSFKVDKTGKFKMAIFNDTGTQLPLQDKTFE
jgi:tetratricopeptide (TPR) repeat protein